MYFNLINLIQDFEGKKQEIQQSIVFFIGGNQINSGIGHRKSETEAHVIQFDGSSATSRSQDRGLPTSPLLLGRDADDDKYKRRSAISFLSRWWRSTLGMLEIQKRIDSLNI